MKHVIKYFGEEVELRKKLSIVAPNLGKVFIYHSALDNRIELDVSEEEHYAICEGLGEGVYSEENASLSSVLVDFLSENHLTVATAESCTGGLVASKIVGVPGASKVFYEGVVTYTNSAKEERLNVSKDTLNTFGAVSEQTAKEMAYGLLSENVDIAVSTTGIAGPDGGTEEKPVGTVYIGIAFQAREPIAIKCKFSGKRNEIRQCAANRALYETYSYLFNTL